MLEPHDVDALAARTKARELAWARNEGGDAVAVDADGVRYILSADGAALFVVRPHLGGISRCEESWVRAGPVGHVATAYVSQDPPKKVRRSRRRTPKVKETKALAPVVQPYVQRHLARRQGASVGLVLQLVQPASRVLAGAYDGLIAPVLLTMEEMRQEDFAAPQWGLCISLREED